MRRWARGMLGGGPVSVPGFAASEVDGTRLVGLTNGEPRLVLLDPHGRILASQGNGIVHVHLSSG